MRLFGRGFDSPRLHFICRHFNRFRGIEEVPFPRLHHLTHLVSITYESHRAVVRKLCGSGSDGDSLFSKNPLHSYARLAQSREGSGSNRRKLDHQNRVRRKITCPSLPRCTAYLQGSTSCGSTRSGRASPRIGTPEGCGLRMCCQPLNRRISCG